jgi:hypothetical protein
VLVLRSPAGDEEVVARFPGVIIGGLSIDLACETALVAQTRVGALSSARGVPWTLTAVTLADGGSRDLVEMRSITHLGPAADGWVVCGEHEVGVQALFRLSTDGTLELLVTGRDLIGFQTIPEELLLVAPWQPARSGYPGTGWQAVHAIPMAAVREHGPACAPYPPPVLEEVARAALERAQLEPTRRAVLGRPGHLETFVTAARSVGRNRTGQPLPESPAELDELLVDVGPGTILRLEAHLLLSALLVSTLQRTEEVEVRLVASGPDHRPAPVIGADLQGSAWAIGGRPDEIICSTLMVQGKWWFPGTTLLDQARGRVLVLGLDQNVVAQEIASLEQAGLEELTGTGDERALIATLEQRPRNRYLREHVYLMLGSAGRLAVLEAVARHFVETRDDPALEDLTGWLAARVVRGSGDDCAGLIADLRAAIERHPETPGLYLLLGQTYEGCPGDSSQARARACYQEALDRDARGRVRLDALEGLDR